MSNWNCTKAVPDNKQLLGLPTFRCQPKLTPDSVGKLYRTSLPILEMFIISVKNHPHLEILCWSVWQICHRYQILVHYRWGCRISLRSLCYIQ